MPAIPLFDHEALIDRLTAGAAANKREVVFLVGAPASAPATPSDPGVLDVEGIINLIRSLFATNLSALAELNKEIAKTPQYRYQAAFNFVLARRGQDSANEIIRKAVLGAHRRNKELLPGLKDMVDTDFRNLENQVTDWCIPSNLLALGNIAAKFPTPFGRRILTSNFDPLIELALNSVGASQYRTVLARDGSINITESSGCHVIHLHGYWYGADTLHTPRQLRQPRPQLRASLSKLLSNSTVVTLAYGGWDDIFTDALVSVLGDDTTSPDVIWTFFEPSAEKIRTRQKRLLQKLTNGIDRGRVNPYKGIDCHSFLPLLLESLEKHKEQAKVNDAPAAPVSSVVVLNSAGAVPSKSSAPARSSYAMSDSPPRVDVWVGRDSEFNAITRSSSPIAVVTGIGGQGKSALVSVCFEKLVGLAQLDFWDWRDCREEGDRFNTQISLIIERLTDGQTSAGDLDGLDTDALVETFMREAATKACLFVFDNVDHYIDLETLRPTSGLEVLFRKALTRNHKCRFIFTCRPNIKADDPGILPIALSDGLSEDETFLLFERRGVDAKSERALISDARSLTSGHPLWLNLIAVQVANDRISLPKILAAIRRGQGALPENTLDEIWKTLKDKQITILRTMAEMVRPETEERIAEFVRGRNIHYAQYFRHKGILIALNLIVVKPRQTEPDRFDLHPIIREYIKAKFPKSEQEKYITTIIVVLDRFIGQFKSALDTLTGSTTLEIMENWTQKVELSINKRDFKAAAETLGDIGGHLLSRGYPEVLIRVSRRLFDAIDWSKEFQGTGPFDSVLGQFVRCLIQFGESDESERLLKRYQEVIPGKTSQFINLCDLRCYFHWYSKVFVKAIDWGEEGVALKETTKADVVFSSAHNLALARRDYGLVDEALKFFLGTTQLELITKPGVIDQKRDPSFYGNIGRCLHLLKNVADALTCYQKSAQLLENRGHAPLQKLNQGYARAWIAEALEEQGLSKEAYFFWRAAIRKWEKISPPRAAESKSKLIVLESKLGAELPTLAGISEEGIETECTRWIFDKPMRI